MITKVIVLGVILTVNADPNLFNQFMSQNGKTYKTQSQQVLRYQIFQQNLNTINEHNEKHEQGLVSWKMGTNQFTDMTHEEFMSTLGTLEYNITENIKLYTPNTNVKIPESIDWRDRGVVTGVKNQGNCGSCWSFSATGTLEGQYALKYNQLVSFSEQDLLDCATQSNGYSCSGCSGGVIQSGLDFVRDHGLTTEDKYPYKAFQASCGVSDSDIVVKTQGYTGIGYNDENGLKNAVGSVGPVSVALNAEKFQFYSSGIFDDDTCSDAINHGVLAVGYGSENGQEYWIVKNSWGEGFGESGYIRMAIGKNLCAIARQACFPNL